MTRVIPYYQPVAGRQTSHEAASEGTQATCTVESLFRMILLTPNALEFLYQALTNAATMITLGRDRSAEWRLLKLNREAYMRP